MTTEGGLALAADIVVAGIGVAPATGLAEGAGLTVANGIVVNEMLRTSQPDIYAAGDNALFPSRLLGTPMRLEHWDNSVSQGKAAGRNMAGARSLSPTSRTSTRTFSTSGTRPWA